MGLFSRNYEAGGEHHVRITDVVFTEALNLIAKGGELKGHYKKLANEFGCGKYEAHDFPVTEIIGAFLLSYELQEEKMVFPKTSVLGIFNLEEKTRLSIPSSSRGIIHGFNRKQFVNKNLGIVKGGKVNL
ncbi:MAG: hypothetical protein HZA78_03860 [Candidatus Schekmanbacteria bacterium]|nr:hypothetical protein [Candidatus Schekmanbacteria bacterium]